ncbi:MAG: hypothetical protein GXO76_11000 [Calditrichaeota bacterium]|nr:hypothetical protein [Calditrichota bacterium]
MKKLVLILIPLLFFSGHIPRLAAQPSQGAPDRLTPPLFLVVDSTLPLQQESSISPKPIPPGRAFLQSLLIPGWAEWKSGAKKRARFFWITEGLLAATFTGFQIYGYMKEQDYRAYGAIHAGANFSNKPERFATNISYYTDILEYNEYQRRLRRYDLTYPLTQENWWEWDSEGSMHTFNHLRIQSETAYRNAVITLGVVLMNHVISGIDAIWTTRQYNKRLQAVNPGWKFRTVYNSLPAPYWAVQLQKTF